MKRTKALQSLFRYSCRSLAGAVYRFAEHNRNVRKLTQSVYQPGFQGSKGRLSRQPLSFNSTRFYSDKKGDKLSRDPVVRSVEILDKTGMLMFKMSIFIWVVVISGTSLAGWFVYKKVSGYLKPEEGKE